MSYKVWVAWEDFNGEHRSAEVENLDNDAIVDDLRNRFVRDRRLEIDAATVDVFKVEGVINNKLKAGVSLSPYFVTANKAEEHLSGHSEDNALIVTLPKQQQQPVSGR